MTELTPREKRSIDELYGILAGYRREIDRLARAQDTRLTTLGPNDAINFVDGEGKPLLQLGGRGAGVNGDLIKYLDGPVPEAPGEPLITGGAGVIHVTLGDGAEPSDAKLCRVHASLDPNFEPSVGTMVGSVQPGHRSVSLSIQAGTWYCCVQWLTLSGKESEVSPVVQVEVDAMVDMSDLDDARAEADKRWADFAVREQEYQDAIADAQARIEAAEQLFESMPEPLELEDAIQKARDAIEAVGDVSQRLQDAETAIQTNAAQTSQNLADLNTTLTNSFTQGINAAKIEAAETAEEKAEAAKIAAVNEAAQNAQTEYDRLQAAADEALQAAVTAAGNLWPDPSFEMGGKGLSPNSNYEIVEESRARHGTHVARMINAGTIYQRDFLPAENDDYLHCEVWVYRTSVNQLGTVQLRPQRIATDGTTGSYTAITFDLADAPVNEWTKVSALAQISHGSRNISGARLYLQINGDVTGLLLDSVKYVNVNAAQEALQAASAAQSRADAAHALAGTAESNAQLAMTAAGRKTRVSYSTAAPSGTADEGDVWRRRDANNVIIGEWVRVGNSWVSTAVSGSMVSNMDVGYLTAGAATIGTGVIEQILADGILANILEVARATVAARNLAPPMTDEVNWTLNTWSQATAEFEDRVQSSTGRAIRLTPGEAGLGGSASEARSSSFEVTPGETLKMSLKMGRIGSGRPAGGQWYFGLLGVDANGNVTNFGPYAFAAETDSHNWDQFFEETVTVPEGMTRAQVRLLLQGNASSSTTPASNAHTTFYDVRVTSMVDGSVVVENSLTADTLIASRELITKIFSADIGLVNELIVQGNLFANHVTALNAALRNLSVTEKANFVSAFADQLYADDFAARVAVIGRLIVAARNLFGTPDFQGDSFSPWSVVNGGIEKNGTSSQNGTYASGEVNRLPVVEGETYTVTADVSWLQGTSGDVAIYFAYDNAAGSQLPGATNVTRNISYSRRGEVTGTFTMSNPPAGAAYVKVGFYTQSSMSSANRVRIENVRIQNSLDGTLTVPGTIAAEALRISEIWANSTWQGEAHFGAEDATYRTRIDGQGVEVYQKGETTDDGTSDEVPVVQLGTGGDNAFSALVDGEVVGGIGQDGTVTGSRVVSADDALIAGYPVFGKLLDEEIPSRGEGWSMLDQLPRGVVAAANRDMSSTSVSSPTHWGFLELGFEGIWDRMYRLNISPFRASSNYIQKVVVSYDGSTPAISAETTSGTQVYLSYMSNGVGGGSYLLSPNTGTVRILVGMYSASPGLSFPGGTGHVRMWVEDVGSRVEWSGVDRYSTQTSGGGTSGNTGIDKKTSYHSAWRPSWMRSFMSGGSLYQTTGKGASELRQGRDRYWSGGGIQTSAFGGFTSSAVSGETSRTISSALSGATLDSGSIELRGSYVPGGGSAVVRLHWHTLSSRPGSYTSTANHVGDYSISAGGSRRIALPASVLNAIKSGSFGGFGLNPRGSTSQTYALGVSWNVRPTLRLKYTR